MSVRGLHQFEGRKDLRVKFILQDPQALTGKEEREVMVSAAVGQNLLQAALEAGIGIEHTCGGVGACSTCHVYVNKGAQRLSAMSDAEADRLDEAPGVKPRSRLACQAVIVAGVTGEELEVEVPGWNRNLVRESGGE